MLYDCSQHGINPGCIHLEEHLTYGKCSKLVTTFTATILTSYLKAVFLYFRQSTEINPSPNALPNPTLRKLGIAPHSTNATSSAQ